MRKCPDVNVSIPSETSGKVSMAWNWGMPQFTLVRWSFPQMSTSSLQLPLSNASWSSSPQLPTSRRSVGHAQEWTPIWCGAEVGEIALFVSLPWKHLQFLKCLCCSHNVGAMVASYYQCLSSSGYKPAKSSPEWSSGQVWYHLQTHCFVCETHKDYNIRHENLRLTNGSWFRQNGSCVVYSYAIEHWTRSRSIWW